MAMASFALHVPARTRSGAAAQQASGGPCSPDPGAGEGVAETHDDPPADRAPEPGVGAGATCGARAAGFGLREDGTTPSAALSNALRPGGSSTT